MARQKDESQIAKCESRIAAARKFRREEGYDDLWDRMVDMYRGKHYDNVSPEDRLVVNLAFSTANVILPSVAVNHPKITVNARKDDEKTIASAIITEAVTNYWWRRYKVREEERRIIKDFIVVGHGWAKIGYRYVEEERIGADADASDPNAEGNDSTPVTVVTEDRPFVERVSFRDMFVDPDATSMRDMKWIAQRIRRTLAACKADKRYTQAGRQALSSSYEDAQRSREAHPNRRKARDPEQQYVDVFEFYDLERQTMCVFAEGCHKYLVAPKPFPYDIGHPYVMLRNYDVPDMFYPIGDLEAMESIQRELNETRTQMMNHRKKYARKYLVRKQSLGEDGKRDLESDRDNTMIDVIDDTPLADVVRSFPAEMTPPEFYNQSGMLINDAHLTTGVTEYQQGALSEIRRTATEAAITQDAANARAADKLALIEVHMAEVAEKLIGIAQQFMEGEDVVRIVGASGAPAWVRFDRDYISGQFDFEVEVGSTAPVNESFRRQSALQLMDAMAPFVQAGVVDAAKLAAHVLQYGFGIKSPERFLAAAPPMSPDGVVPQEAPPGLPGGGAPPEFPPDLPPDLGGMMGGPGLGGGQVPSEPDPQMMMAMMARLGAGGPP